MALARMTMSFPTLVWMRALTLPGYVIASAVLKMLGVWEGPF